MNVKTYQAASMAEALAKVKGELGGEAVILHTRSFRAGGWMGMGSRQVVEVTAGTNVALATRNRSKPAPGEKMTPAPARTLLKQAYGLSDARRGSPAETPRSAPQRLAETPRGTDAPRGGEAPRSDSSSPLENASSYRSTREMAAAMLKDPSMELRNEMSSLRTMVEELLHRSSPAQGKGAELPELLSNAYRSLIEQQVAEEIAIRVLQEVKAEIPPEQLSNPILVRERLTTKLERLIPTQETLPPLAGAAQVGPRTICLIGPTGVGKTTTLAKLAAVFKLRQKQKVGLITVDTYRIAAVDQLRMYANIIGVPLKVAMTAQELQEARRELSETCDTILIDTAGRSPRDQLKIQELAGFIQGIQPTEVHLVLSSTCTQAAMESAVEQFSQVRFDRILFTKLDEAVSFGVLLNVARKTSKALSYLTTGQDVPDHIELGQPRRLARLILGEKL